MTKDNEYKVCSYLGLRKIAHFIDMNPADVKIFDLPYIGVIKKCEEAERRLAYLTSKCAEYQIELTPCASVSELTTITQRIAQSKHMVSFTHLLPFVCSLKNVYLSILRKTSGRSNPLSSRKNSASKQCLMTLMLSLNTLQCWGGLRVWYSVCLSVRLNSRLFTAVRPLQAMRESWSRWKMLE